MRHVGCGVSRGWKGGKVLYAWDTWVLALGGKSKEGGPKDVWMGDRVRGLSLGVFFY
jgi:hypothetical protein